MVLKANMGFPERLTNQEERDSKEQCVGHLGRTVMDVSENKLNKNGKSP